MTNSSGARRAAHTRLRSCTPAGGLPSPAWRSPPTPYLLRRAGPVNRGAVWGWVQLDGRRLLLGHFEPRKGASNSEGKAAPLASSLCAVPRPPRGANSESRARGLPARGRAPRGPVSAEELVAVSQDPPPYSPRARRAGNRRVSSPGQFSSPGFLPSFPQSTGLLGYERLRRARTRALLQPQPKKVQPPLSPRF